MDDKPVTLLVVTHTFTYSLSKHSLHIEGMAGTALGTGNRAEEQTDHQTTLPALVELAFSRLRDSQQ